MSKTKIIYLTQYDLFKCKATLAYKISGVCKSVNPTLDINTNEINMRDGWILSVYKDASKNCIVCEEKYIG